MQTKSSSLRNPAFLRTFIVYPFPLYPTFVWLQIIIIHVTWCLFGSKTCVKLEFKEKLFNFQPTQSSSLLPINMPSCEMLLDIGIQVLAIDFKISISLSNRNTCNILFTSHSASLNNSTEIIVDLKLISSLPIFPIQIFDENDDEADYFILSNFNQSVFFLFSICGSEFLVRCAKSIFACNLSVGS